MARRRYSKSVAGGIFDIAFNLGVLGFVKAIEGTLNGVKNLPKEYSTQQLINERKRIALLNQEVLKLKNEGLNCFDIADDFNKRNIPIPKSSLDHTLGKKTWTPNLVDNLWHTM